MVSFCLDVEILSAIKINNFRNSEYETVEMKGNKNEYFI